jgi:hypothetical protein
VTAAHRGPVRSIRERRGVVQSGEINRVTPLAIEEVSAITRNFFIDRFIPRERFSGAATIRRAAVDHERMNDRRRQGK